MSNANISHQIYVIGGWHTPELGELEVEAESEAGIEGEDEAAGQRKGVDRDD